MKHKIAARSLFFDDWQACLRAHYVYVIRANDGVTAPSLRLVLLQSGLSESDLRALHEQAYALGSLDPGTVLPELEEVPVELVTPASAEEPPVVEPGEPAYDELGVVVEAGNDETIVEEEPVSEEPPQEDEPPPDFGRQLSLF